jgi:hypothetical protein
MNKPLQLQSALYIAAPVLDAMTGNWSVTEPQKMELLSSPSELVTKQALGDLLGGEVAQLVLVDGIQIYVAHSAKEAGLPFNPVAQLTWHQFIATDDLAEALRDREASVYGGAVIFDIDAEGKKIPLTEETCALVMGFYSDILSQLSIVPCGAGSV